MTKTANPAKAYVKLIAKKFPVLNGHPTAFVHYSRIGREFTYHTLSDQERRYVDRVGKQSCGLTTYHIKQCYFNSQYLLCRPRNRFHYWEGFACAESLPIPVHHAWLTLDDTVVDVTVDALRRQNHNQSPWYYFGVEFSKELVRANQITTRCAGPLTENPAMWARLLKTVRP